MAYPYQKHIWVTREVIRREYLQNIEDGIYDEQEARLAAESQLSGDITAEYNRARTAENALTTDIQAETTRATNAEQTISGNLTDEIRRATNREDEIAADVNSMTTQISDEVLARQTACNALSVSISNEVTRATTAENNLRTYVNEKVSSIYKPCGSIEFNQLPPLSASVLGNVYNIKDAFTTTDDFLEGAGKDYPAGTNVAIVYVEGNYRYDALTGFVDLSDYVKNTDKATTEKIGLVKPDGSTIIVDQFGMLTVVGGGGGSGSGEESEAWAVGERNGVPVSPDDVTYHNNSKYYAEQCFDVLQQVEAYAALMGIVLGTLYVTTEADEHLITESGDNIVFDY